VTYAAPALANQTRSCKDAALGLENATRSVRAPDNVVAQELTARCNEDTWPSAAVECFATMREGDLGKCANALPDSARDHMFAVLGGGGGTAGIAVARARLEQLTVGVPACDQFISAVSGVLTCDQVPVETRVQLGQETVEFWSLPTSKLAAEDLDRMSTVCGQSLAALLAQTQGCSH
jgi:hypothetical protein